ncbi:MAG: cation:dicarboxylate symporter family transporter [Planctomycetota bacterium]|jgi:Na+/H+-dicarboxylate symporter
MSEHPAQRRRLGLSAQILIGLLAGIAAGIVLGELSAGLKIVGDAFIALLQMTVLPYVMFALVANIGGLTWAEAKRLAARGGVLLLIFWGIGLSMIVLMPLAFPDLRSASFFSTSLVEQPPRIDLLGLYIPANPFHSLANNVVPAVVLFSIALGAALMNVPGKEAVIDLLSVFTTALMRVNLFVVRLTPLGVFALAASVTGTLTLEEFSRLQAYLITYILAALLLTFCILPMLLAAWTPFSYRQILRCARDPLVTAFTTGSLFIVLPMLTERIRALFADHRAGGKDGPHFVDVLLPVAYSFPTLGKLLSLLFIPFAAWFSGHQLTAGQYPALLPSGLLSYFGSTNMAQPFLLDLMRLPSDLFQLFIIARVFCERFGTLTSSMYLLVFTILTTCALVGAMKLQRGRIVGFLGVAVVLTFAAVVSTRVYLSAALEGTYDKDKLIEQMQLLVDPVKAVVLAEAGPNPVPLRSGQSRLERIRQRGILRVGHREMLPFSYRNIRDELVGFDIEMAHRLADELGVTLEFVPIDIHRVAEHLDADHCDVVMSGVAATTPRFEQMEFSTSYLDATLALVVPDHRRHDFSKGQKILAMEAVRVGLIGEAYWLRKLRGMAPNVEFVPLESEREFFENPDLRLDAIVTSAEGGSAWTLVYPDYQVVIPDGHVIKQPLGYPVARGEWELKSLLDQWVALKAKDGAIERAYAHWILGRQARPRDPRWSVLRNVLGWVD